MIELFRGWVSTINLQYLSPLDHRRALGMLYLNLLIVVGAVIIFIASNALPAMRGTSLSFNAVLPLIVVIGMAVGIHYFLLAGSVRLAAWLFVALVGAIAVAPHFNDLHNTSVVFLMVPVLAAGVLLNRRELLIALGALAVAIALASSGQAQLSEPVTVVKADETGRDLGILMATMVVGAAFLLIFSTVSEWMANSILKTRERMDLLVEARLGSAPDENGVLARVADMLMEEMLYNFAQVYMLDEEGRLNAYVRIGMGTRHSASRITLSGQNALMVAMRRAEPVQVSADDPYEKRSHLLPASTFAIALPLIFGERVIGVLDVQSNDNDNPFQHTEMTFFRLLASDLADALAHVTTRNQIQNVLETREAANQRLETQVADLKRQLEQSLGSDWTSYIQGRNQLAFGFNMLGRNLALTQATDLPEHLQEAMLRGEVVVERREHEQVINLPIKRYNDVLGAMSFTLPANQPLTERQINLASTVANRLAVALENARLVEQSRSQAARERKAGEVSSQLLGHQEISVLLDAAAQSFNEALGAIYTRIYLEPEALHNRSEEAV